MYYFTKIPLRKYPRTMDGLEKDTRDPIPEVKSSGRSNMDERPRADNAATGLLYNKEILLSRLTASKKTTSTNANSA